MQAFLEAGYPYEIVGLAYYVFFLVMGRQRFAGRFTLRTRVLVLVAAIVLVACVPVGYARSGIGVAVMFAAAFVALVSAALDARAVR